MKKLTCLVLALTLLTLTACSGTSTGSKTAGKNGNSVSDVLEQQMNGGNTATTAAVSEVKGNVAGEEVETDVDLTALSSTMVYSEVYNMMTEPEQYRGKIVKMRGQFAIYHDESTDVYYFACVIADATACCQQGMEFVLDGDFDYPEDYPELGAEITVVGEFQTYLEGSTQYCHLIDANLLEA